MATINKKIVFINQATGYLTIDVINQFAQNYKEVALICGSVRVQDTELDHNVKVSQIALYNRGNNRQKALSWLWGTIQIFWLLMTKYRNFEVFYYTIPPLGYLLAPLFKAPFNILIYDLYPDALKVKGYSEISMLYKWWSRWNKRAFTKANSIIVISEVLKRKVLKYASNANVEVIPNWSAFSDKKPIERAQNKLIRKEGLNDKFVVQYSGNIGVTHNVETIVEVAESLRDTKDIEFLIIGRGERTNNIKDQIRHKGLLNCKVLPFRKDEELYESLCVADIAVVTLDERVPDVSVPSKTYNILSAGVPLMVIASLTSSISQLVQQKGIGETFVKSEVNAMKDFILRMKEDRSLRRKYAHNTLVTAQEFTSNNAVRIYERVVCAKEVVC